MLVVALFMSWAPRSLRTPSLYLSGFGLVWVYFWGVLGGFLSELDEFGVSFWVNCVSLG